MPADGSQALAVSATALPGRKSSRRWWIAVALACFGFFLFTPKTPSTACIQIITVFNAVQLPLNCDSRLLAKLYRDAEKYFTEFNNWKGRPVYFLYGVVAAPVMEPIAVPLWAAISGHARSDRKLSHFSKYFSLHLAYYLLNIGTVLFALWLALNLLGLDRSGLLAVSLSAAIASTDLVAGTLWLAHTNIFNLLAPIACAFFVRIGFQARVTRPATLCAWAGFGGMMVLVYPLFIVALPAFLAGLVLDWLFNRKRGDYRRPDLLALSIACILFVAPVLVWGIVVRTLFATPTYMTAQYGQFVWILAAARDGILAQSLLAHWREFVGTLQLHFNWFETLLPALGAALLLIVGDRSKVRLLDPVMLALAIAALGILGFNFFQGYYAARLQISVASLFYMAVARLAHQVERPRVGAFVLLAIFVAQLADAAANYALTAE